MIIESLSAICAPTNKADVQLSAFNYPLPQALPPSGDGVVGFGDGGMHTAQGLKIIPYGQGDDGQTFSMNVYGWHVQPSVNAIFPVWVPVLLATFTNCTLDTSLPGIAQSPVDSSHFFCRSITAVFGVPGYYCLAPGAHQIAHVYVPSQGARFMDVRFSTGGIAGSCNALGAKL